jgi:hypothetical protein
MYGRTRAAARACATRGTPGRPGTPAPVSRAARRGAPARRAAPCRCAACRRGCAPAGRASRIARADGCSQLRRKPGTEAARRVRRAPRSAPRRRGTRSRRSAWDEWCHPRQCRTWITPASRAVLRVLGSDPCILHRRWWCGGMRVLGSDPCILHRRLVRGRGQTLASCIGGVGRYARRAPRRDPRGAPVVMEPGTRRCNDEGPACAGPSRSCRS